MPSILTLGVFSGAALVLLLIPGPAVLYVTTRSAAQGRRAGIVSVLGIHTGTMVHIVAAVAGLSALIAASAQAFTLVKVVGAAYLILLGLRTIVGPLAESDGALSGPRSLRRLYIDGIVVNVLNPKTALFFLAFLPQFVRPSGPPAWVQTFTFGVLFVAIGLVTDSAYALAGAHVGRWLRGRPRFRRRRGSVVEGGLLVGLGVSTLLVPHRRPA